MTKDNWDRVQNFAATTNQPQEMLYEIGRLAKMATDKDTLESSLSISQFEYGTIDSFLQLAGQAAEPGAGLTLADFDDPRTDFYSPGKDEYGGTVEQTLWLQHLAVDSIGLNINAAERLERTFELSGNYAKICHYGNKYLIFKEDDVASGVSGSYNITLSDPVPVVDPNNAGIYILDIWRIRSGVATQLTITTDYTYTNGTTILNIIAAVAGDNYRIWYTAASYGSAGDPTALNAADDYYLDAEFVTITMDDGVNSAIELDKLTGMTISASLNRTEEPKIGSTEKFRDVESYDVSVNFTGFVKDSAIQEALMHQAGQSWEIIDYSLFGSVDVIVKIYSEAAKTNFMIGYKITDMDFSSDGNTKQSNSNSEATYDLTSDNLLITTTIGNL